MLKWPGVSSACSCRPFTLPLTSSSRSSARHSSVPQPTFTAQRPASSQPLWPRPGPSRASLRRTLTMTAKAQASPKGSGKTGVLFVCLGNICRSPTAEAMFRAVVERAGMADQFNIDSCGTGGGAANWYKPGGYSYHEGDPADPRMTKAASARGVKLTSRSRPLLPSDLATYDYIIAMDLNNRRDILRAISYWGEQDKQLPGLEEMRDRVSLMMAFSKDGKQGQGLQEVPDPYYGGPSGFETVLDLLEDACTGLLQHIQEQQQVKA